MCIVSFFALCLSVCLLFVCLRAMLPDSNKIMMMMMMMITDVRRIRTRFHSQQKSHEYVVLCMSVFYLSIRVRLFVGWNTGPEQDCVIKLNVLLSRLEHPEKRCHQLNLCLANLKATAGILCHSYAVVACEIKSFWNNFEIISVFCFACNHW